MIINQQWGVLALIRVSLGIKRVSIVYNTLLLGIIYGGSAARPDELWALITRHRGDWLDAGSSSTGSGPRHQLQFGRALLIESSRNRFTPFVSHCGTRLVLCTTVQNCSVSD